jgi:CheY-like chemotaxis protein
MRPKKTVKRNLRILLIEDSATDAELIDNELKACGLAFNLAMIQSELELRRELELERPDLILSDHGLPSFDGFKALEIVREQHPDLPFIFVSGSNNQAMVLEMYEQGATDYVFKNDLGDLRLSIQYALEPPPEPPPALPEPAAQSETAPIMQPVSGTIRLQFCPDCHHAWDETGGPVLLEDCFEYNTEVVVIRKRCAKCEQSHANR